jgi:hypothetical protein
MRKHRLYGVVIAVLLLGTTPFKGRPSASHQLSSGRDNVRTDTQLTAAELPADQADIAASAALPALVSDTTDTPGTTTNPGTSALSAGNPTVDALWSANSAGRTSLGTAVALSYTQRLALASYLVALRGAATPPAPPHPVTAAVQHPAAAAVRGPATTPVQHVAVGGAPGVWAALRHCESNGNYADDTGNGYYGAYQFSAGTWHGLGLSGLPSQAPPSVQDQAAQRLQARSGWGQWPSCARVLGLR